MPADDVEYQPRHRAPAAAVSSRLSRLLAWSGVAVALWAGMQVTVAAPTEPQRSETSTAAERDGTQAKRDAVRTPTSNRSPASKSSKPREAGAPPATRPPTPAPSPLAAPKRAAATTTTPPTPRAASTREASPAPAATATRDVEVSSNRPDPSVSPKPTPTPKPARQTNHPHLDATKPRDTSKDPTPVKAPTRAPDPVSTTVSVPVWNLTAAGRTNRLIRGGQATIDTCAATVFYGSLPGQRPATDTLWLAGHDYCGYDRWRTIAVGDTVTLSASDGRTAVYRITNRVHVAQQGGSSRGLIHSDLVLQTCEGAGTSLTYATRIR